MTSGRHLKSATSMSVFFSRSLGGSLIWLALVMVSSVVDASEPLTAEVRSVDGTPTLLINGQPHNPLMFWGSPGTGRCPVPVQTGPQWQKFSTSFEAFENQPNTALHIRMGGDKANRVWIRNVSFSEAAGANVNVVRHPAFTEEWEKDWILFVRTDTGAKASARPEGDGLVVDIADGGADPMYVHLFQKGHALTAGRKYTFSVELRSERPQTVELLVVEAGGDWTQYTCRDGGPVADEIRLAAAAGVHIHSFSSPMPWVAGDKAPDYAMVDECFDAVLRADPDGLLIPRFGIDAPASWKERHPTEVMTYDDGSRGQASMASEVWRRDVETSLRRFVEHVEARYGQRVIGYHPCGQHTGEWFYDRTWEARLSGFEPAFAEGFRRFLVRKYGDDAAGLRQAWRDEKIAFDTITVPDKEERLQAGLGVFRDPSAERRLIDFNEYLQVAMVEPLERFARAIKETTARKKLVVLFYGYLFEIANLPHGPAASGHLAMGRLLQCPDVDILCSPISYGDRGLVGSTPFMVAVDSVRLHGKLWLNEDDTRTWLSAADDPYSRLGTPEHTRWVHLRNFGPVLTRRITCWWMDLPCAGWLNSPEIWSHLGQLKRLYDRDLGGRSQYSPQIAVVADERSPLYTAANSTLSSPLLYNLRAQFNRIGAPVGIYLLSDLVAGRVPESRLYVFPDAFVLTGEQRAALARILHRDHKVAVWLYGAGFIQDTADTRYMTELLEMPVVRGEKPQPLEVRWENTDDPLLNGLQGQTLAAGKPVVPLGLGEPADRCRVLGRFTQNGQAAGAVREESDYCTVYAGTLTVPAGLLRNCARKAGVFLYVESDEVIQTDGRWLFITATNPGRKQVRLPRPVSLRDALNGQVLVTRTDLWNVDLQAGETRAVEIVP